MNVLIASVLSIVLSLFPSVDNTNHLSDDTSITSFSSFEVRQKQNQRKPRVTCSNQLYKWLYKAGFRGHNIREAWAIAMRESNGKPATLSSGVDHGLFQFNRPSWGNKTWWNTQLLLTPEYNAKIAFDLSKGGSDWTPWGMKDHNQFNFSNYGMWSQSQLYNWIVEPYQRYYAQYPC
jgi:hypothetical protein